MCGIASFPDASLGTVNPAAPEDAGFVASDKKPIRNLSYLLTERSEYFNVWQQER